MHIEKNNGHSTMLNQQSLLSKQKAARIFIRFIWRKGVEKPCKTAQKPTIGQMSKGCNPTNIIEFQIKLMMMIQIKFFLFLQSAEVSWCVTKIAKDYTMQMEKCK